MKKLAFLVLFVTVLFSAQNQRFTYEYKFVKDSTEKEKITTEIMDLDITAKGSKFYSSNKKIADSILEGMDRTNPESIDYSAIKWGKVNEIVEKIYPKYNVYLFQSLDSDTYKVEDERKIIWKISPEKETIGNLETQKATTKLYGRTWTAWFSTSLPFQDGPYKFNGLPGLIVKISDDTQSHLFELKAVKNLPKDYEWKSVSEKNNYAQPIALNQDRFKKVYQNFRKDPMASTKQMMGRSGVTMQWTDEKGNKLDPKKEIMEQEKRMIEGFIKDNNLIELDLLK
jgi:GLPGLI family protein